MKIKLIFCALLLTLFQHKTASAAFIDNGSFTTDTETNLDWLDVTLSIGRSYSDISSQITFGGEFDGWRYATDVELDSLIERYTGITSPHMLSSMGYFNDEIDGLITLLGDTTQAWRYSLGATLSYDELYGYAPGEGIYHTRGIVDCFSTCGVYGMMSELLDDDRYDGSGIDRSLVWYGALGETGTLGNAGSFLVRDSAPTPVSEPSSLALMGLSLLGLTRLRRKAR